jgi:hypothetical protein
MSSYAPGAALAVFETAPIDRSGTPPLVRPESNSPWVNNG